MGTLSPSLVGDTFLRQDQATTNQDGNGFWCYRTGGTLAIRPVYDYGDISAIPAGSTIDIATFTLEVTSNADNAETLACHVLSQAFVAAQATWNNRITATAWTNAGGTYEATNGKSATTSPTGTGSKEIDVTDTIQWILDNQPTLCRFLLKWDNEAPGPPGDLRGANAATLDIDFTPDTSTATSLTVNAAGQLVAVFSTVNGSDWNTITTSAASYFEITRNGTPENGTDIEISLNGDEATITVDYATPIYTDETIALSITSAQFVDDDGRSGPTLSGAEVTNNSEEPAPAGGSFAIFQHLLLDD